MKFKDAYWSREELQTELNKILEFVNKVDFVVICKQLFHGACRIDRYYSKIYFSAICACLSVKYSQIFGYLENFFKLHANSSFNIKINAGLKILRLCVINAHLVSIEVFEMLIKYCGVNKINSHDYWLPLHSLYSIEGNHQHLQRNSYESLRINEIDLPDHLFKIIKLFVDHGYNLNLCDYGGRTVLDIFANNWNSELNKYIIKTFIDHGATYSEKHCCEELINFIEGYKTRNIKPAIRQSAVGNNCFQIL